MIETDPLILTNRVAVRLYSALKTEGLQTGAVFDNQDHRFVVDLIDADVRSIATVAGDADSSGRLARICVAWDGPHGVKCRYGAEDVAETFADWNQLAREIKGDIDARG